MSGNVTRHAVIAAVDKTIAANATGFIEFTEYIDFFSSILFY
jgi:hypothetical protein